MRLNTLTCDICHKSFKYKVDSFLHQHPELKIGGVPINIWSPIYTLRPAKKLAIDRGKKGILKFDRYLPSMQALIHSLDEGNTPLKKSDKYSGLINARVYIKDEGYNPTGSFKDRGMPLLLADAKINKKAFVAIPSTGNAAVSLTRYAKLYGITPIVFIPKTTSVSKIDALSRDGKIIFDENLVKSYEHFIEYCGKNHEVYNCWPVVNIPYGQGLKTMAYEIYLQLNRRAPDWVIIPCGSGSNIVSQYYGFKDLLMLGFIKKLPKFVSVQIKRADPITYGFDRSITNKVVVLESPEESKAEAIASDTCFNYFKIMNILKETKGIAVSVNDKDIDKISGYKVLEYSSLAVFPALIKIRKKINKEDIVVLIATAHSRNN